ncbi:hypothetical protein [Paracidovorax oryzae]|uniref:hypothetical protein n=1 Tax=Paracidovorax oryzae TaxID=862720 RepID=UPI000558C913|nr:hypothetical protein [Paracidovorax oryzae]
MKPTRHSARRALRAMLASLPLAALPACDAPPAPTRFSIDLCGAPHRWEDADTRWDTLYAAQLDGDDELVIALRVPAGHQAAPAATGVQFHLTAPPGLLRPGQIASLAGTFRLAAESDADRKPRQPGTGSAVVFRDPSPPWAIRKGELRISEVRTIPKDGQGSARAVATGSYRLDMAPDGAGAGVPSCTVSGTFEGAVFRLKAGTD